MPEPSFLEKLLMRHDSTWRHISEPNVDIPSSSTDKQKQTPQLPLSPSSSSSSSSLSSTQQIQPSESSSVVATSWKEQDREVVESQHQQTQGHPQEQPRQQTQPPKNPWPQLPSEATKQQQSRQERQVAVKDHENNVLLEQAKLRQRQEVEAKDRMEQERLKQAKIRQQQEAEAKDRMEQERLKQAKIRQRQEAEAKNRAEQEQLDQVKIRQRQEMERLEQAKNHQRQAMDRMEQERVEQTIQQRIQPHQKVGKGKSVTLTGKPIDVPKKNPNDPSTGFFNNSNATSSNTGNYGTYNSSMYNKNNNESAPHYLGYPTYRNKSKVFVQQQQKQEVDDERQDNYHRRIFIPNLSNSSTAAELRQFFIKYPVVGVNKKPGASFGFVEFDSMESCLNALKMEQRQEFQGITLNLKRCRPRNTSRHYVDNEESREHNPSVFSRLEPNIQQSLRIHSNEHENDLQSGVSNHSSSAATTGYHQPNDDNNHRHATSVRQRNSTETDYSSPTLDTKRKNLVNYNKERDDQRFGRNTQEYDHYSPYSRRSLRSPDRGIYSRQPYGSSSYSSSSRSDYRSSSSRSDRSRSRSKSSHHRDSSKERQRISSDIYSSELQRSPSNRSETKMAPSDPRKRPSSSSHLADSEPKRSRTTDKDAMVISRRTDNDKNSTKSTDDRETLKIDSLAKEKDKQSNTNTTNLTSLPDSPAATSTAVGARNITKEPSNITPDTTKTTTAITNITPVTTKNTPATEATDKITNITPTTTNIASATTKLTPATTNIAPATTKMTPATTNITPTTKSAAPTTTSNTQSTTNVTHVKNTTPTTKPVISTSPTSSVTPISATAAPATTTIPTVSKNTELSIANVPSTSKVDTTSSMTSATKEDPRLQTKERPINNVNTNTNLRITEASTKIPVDQNKNNNQRPSTLIASKTPGTTTLSTFGQTLIAPEKQQTHIPFVNTAKEKAVIQLICIGSAIQPNAIGDLEDYLEQNLEKVKCRTMLYPAGMMSRDDILKQVHMDGVLAVILLEIGFEEHGKVFLQVYDQRHGGKDSLHFDEYEGISATDAIYIIRQTIQISKELLSTPKVPVTAPLSFLNHNSPPAIKAEPLAMQQYSLPEQQVQQQQQQLAVDLLHQLYYKSGLTSGTTHPGPLVTTATEPPVGPASLTPNSMTIYNNHPNMNMNNESLHLLAEVLRYLETTEQQPYSPGTYGNRLAIISQTLANIKSFQPPLQSDQERAVTRHLLLHLQQLTSVQPAGSTYQPHWQQASSSSSSPYYNIHQSL